MHIYRYGCSSCREITKQSRRTHFTQTGSGQHNSKSVGSPGPRPCTRQSAARTQPLPPLLLLLLAQAQARAPQLARVLARAPALTAARLVAALEPELGQVVVPAPAPERGVAQVRVSVPVPVLVVVSPLGKLACMLPALAPTGAPAKQQTKSDKINQMKRGQKFRAAEACLGRNTRAKPESIRYMLSISGYFVLESVRTSVPNAEGKRSNGRAFAIRGSSPSPPGARNGDAAGITFAISSSWPFASATSCGVSACPAEARDNNKQNSPRVCVILCSVKLLPVDSLAWFGRTEKMQPMCVLNRMTCYDQ